LHSIINNNKKIIMKCIKSIRVSKNVELGEIKRVNDVDADLSVKNGSWSYVSKSEYKKTIKPVVVERVVVEKKVEKTISEKQRESKKKNNKKVSK